MSILQEHREQKSSATRPEREPALPSALGEAEGIAAVRKLARAALVGLNASSAEMLADCFQQFKIEAVVLGRRELERFHTEKFDACVLRLVDGAESVLEAARNSPVNFRMVLYGIVDANGRALRFARYGINIVLDEPLEKRVALRAVRSTHLLVLHEFRRYVRVPLVTPVTLQFQGRSMRGITVEISGGGMSVQAHSLLHAPPSKTAVQMDFTLPDFPPVRIYGVVARIGHGQLGIRFEENHPARAQVRAWIDEFLGIT